jgi:hypothetical protein
MTAMTRKVRAAAVAALTAGVLATVGCAGGPGAQARFQDLNNNNSWPERNSFLARQPVLHSFEVQAHNAAATNGVILNTYFETGSDKLNGVGRDKLDQLARKMPAPDATVFLQTANDVVYDEKAPEKTATARAELDDKRKVAVLAYLGARPNGRSTAFSVQAIDNADPSMNAAGPALAVRGLQQQFKSAITGGIGGGNPLGAGGGQASNTIGVVPTSAPQAGGNNGTGGGTGTGTGGR